MKSISFKDRNLRKVFNWHFSTYSFLIQNLTNSQFDQVWYDTIFDGKWDQKEEEKMHFAQKSAKVGSRCGSAAIEQSVLDTNAVKQLS